MGLDIKELFDDVWKNFLNIAGQAATATAADMPQVQAKIEEAKTREAKNILYQAFPFIGFAILIFFAAKVHKSL